MRLDSLKAILREQEKGCRDLVAILQKERGLLVDLDAGALEALVKEKDTLVMKLRLLEEERVRLIASAARESSCPADGDATLQAIVDRSGDFELAGIRQKLVSLVQSIEDLNGFNRHLIDRSLLSARAAAGFFNAFRGDGPERSASGTLVSRET